MCASGPHEDVRRLAGRCPRDEFCDDVFLDNVLDLVLGLGGVERIDHRPDLSLALAGPISPEGDLLPILSIGAAAATERGCPGCAEGDSPELAPGERGVQ